MASVRICLFFTRGVSLKQWHDMGMFNREVSLYKELQKRGVEVAFVTFGGREDMQFAERIPGITVLCNKWGLKPQWYEKLIPYLFRNELRRADIIKTNQTDGADIALACARKYGKKFIARCGYMWSDFIRRQQGEGSAALAGSLAIEQSAFTAADRIVVTTKAMADDVISRIPNSSGKTQIIPNFVDTDIFAPIQDANKECDLAFVGRLSPQKNLESLLDAIGELDVRIRIIGQGELGDKLKSDYAHLGGKVEWMGAQPNHELPRLINSAKAFILPSHYEGHPKTLLEAMACGAAVIGANTPGIKEAIIHGETGWLCAKDSNGIREAISAVLADESLIKRLGDGAREHILNNMSLNRVAEMEKQLYESLLGINQ